ncbi:ATP-binding domain-containing protein [Candidatus Dojkabacteria bacterium]|jgi:DNA helicase-2/ATP-dependent DNA helicase PcrA|nr:ATP-binding domain-containing protein [Candidatus Dojkabacteria bacterium]
MLSYKKYLNPLANKLDEIADFSKLEINGEFEREEYPYLKNVVKITTNEAKIQIKKLEQLEKDLEDIIKIIDNETGDAKVEAIKDYNLLLKEVKVLLSRINRAIAISDSSYFGKIVIDRKANKLLPRKTVTSYIGKFAYFDTKTKEALITDWRAPIANLYYTNSGPTKDVSYTPPVGEIKCDLIIKRQFEINFGRIQHIYDAISGNVSADEFLLAQLKKRLGKKLTDIVATIQNQQNSIIRNEINKIMILQGVAGSGKTTILLHRLAYLFFAYPEIIHPERTLIVAPNRMFLDYISDLLPSLGVEGVESNTYLFWAKKILNFNDRYQLSSNQPNLIVRKEKGSIDFIHIISEFFEEYERDMLEELPYSGNDEIFRRYYGLKEKHPEIAVLERIRLATEGAFMNTEFKKTLVGSYMGKRAVTETIRTKVDEYIRKKMDIKRIYKELISNSKYVSKELIRYSKDTFGKTKTIFSYTSEDLAPLIWLYNKVFGNTEYLKECIVVDEAQDMSPFEIFTLYLFSKKQNLFLAGDLAQSIIPPFYIKDWNEIISIFNKYYPTTFKHSYHQLNKCYRTTIEIIDFANNIFKKYFPKEYKLPEAVLRHGDKVEIINTEKELFKLSKTKLAELAEKINLQFELGGVTVALICKDDKHSNEVYEYLLENKELFSNDIYTYSDNDYKTGILVLPITKAKGLEFDSVFIVDINAENYKENELDTRQLYVAITRPLHRLFLITNGDPSKLLS